MFPLLFRRRDRGECTQRKLRKASRCIRPRVRPRTSDHLRARRSAPSRWGEVTRTRRQAAEEGRTRILSRLEHGGDLYHGNLERLRGFRSVAHFKSARYPTIFHVENVWHPTNERSILLAWELLRRGQRFERAAASTKGPQHILTLRDRKRSTHRGGEHPEIYRSTGG